MKPEDQTARHRLARNRWFMLAGFCLIARIIIRVAWPWLSPWTITSTTWIWCVVGAAYHIGWLRHGKDGAK